MTNTWQMIFNFISAIVTLIISVISLFIALLALKISRKIYIYSSKDYIPEIEYSIDDNDETLTIVNKSKDLFTIKSINFIKIITLGFEDYEKKTLTQIPFITRSTLWWWIDKSQKIVLKKDNAGACAYQICPYDNNTIKSVMDKVYKDYSMDSKKGYASPGYQGLKFILEVEFENSFQERKSVAFCKEHFHGTGFQYFRISDKQLAEIIKSANVPKFDNFDDLWSHLLKTYSYPF